MSHVDLGFPVDCETWRLQSYHFPSKIGGKPAWLDLENILSPEQLQCDTCHQPLIFLCQIYAPFEEDPSNFHRTVFIFICKDPKCGVANSNTNIKAFRCSLPRENKFYSSEPPEEKEDPNFSLEKWTKLCNVCGCMGTKVCSKCKLVNYCSREHQVVDWKEGHKTECGVEEKCSTRHSFKLFSQFELVIEAEPDRETSVDEGEEMRKFEEMQKHGKTGTMSEVADSDIEQYAISDTDKAFTRFKERVADNTDQVLRYERGGQPLWIADDPKPDLIPDCEYCMRPRQFEFQIMPQMLTALHENELDFGVIVVYSCSGSCTGGVSYKKEFVFKQDIAT